ncbi:MAG: UrcA family protein [Alphaproteobacteria bacterium]
MRLHAQFRPIRWTLVGGAAALTIGMIGAVPALAQDDDQIIVPAPYHIHRDVNGETESVEVSRIVTADGLDLRYDSDVYQLRQRIHDAAWDACDAAGQALHGESTTSDRECVRQAIRGAEPQAEDAIARARG